MFNPQPKPQKREKKPRKPLKKSNIKGKKKKTTGELELFQQIWSEREHVCQVTGATIEYFSVMCFMHVVSKGAYGSLRLDPRNILLVTPEVHIQYDTVSRKQDMFLWVNELHDNLIQEYYGDRNSKC